MNKEKAAFSGSLASWSLQGNYITASPAPDSQCAEILAELQRGKSLTSYEMHMMGFQGAATRILELRRMGWPIVCIMEKHVNKHGKTVNRGRYFLAAKEGEA